MSMMNPIGQRQYDPLIASVGRMRDGSIGIVLRGTTVCHFTGGGLSIFAHLFDNLTSTAALVPGADRSRSSHGGSMT
jgi:hypothetical protein